MMLRSTRISEEEEDELAGYWPEMQPEAAYVSSSVSPSKRKRCDNDSETDRAINGNIMTTDFSLKRAKIPRLDCIQLTSLSFPKSRYYGWEPPIPMKPEEDALTQFLVSFPRH